MKLLTNVQAKRLDKIALNKHSRTGNSLMENAGRCVSNLAISLLKKVQNPEILVICGKGNNGGDGFVAASILKENNYNVSIHIFIPEDMNTQLRSSFMPGEKNKNLKQPDEIANKLIKLIRKI